MRFSLPQCAPLLALVVLAALPLVSSRPALQDRDGQEEKARDNDSSALGYGSPLSVREKKGRKASDFFVDGKHIPGVPFEVTDSYAGLLPLTDKPKEDRELFFWWYPSETDVGKDDLVIWLNGGPGCSSLEGLLQENGPVLFPFNKTDVEKNPYSWHKLANVLWVEQPVTTGLGKGNLSVHNEREVGQQFYSFLVQFFKTFPTLRNKRLYITGESYAGRFVPYIANEILFNHSDKENKKNGLNYQGIAINDPTFIRDTVSEQLPAVEFAEQHKDVLQLNQTFLDHLKKYAKKNGVEDFIAKNVVYPPKGPILLPASFNESSYDAFDQLVAAITDVNPCFNIYNIEYRCPSIYDPLGFPPDATEPSATNIINNITGFKEYVHADPSTVWYECSFSGGFIGGDDTSKAPADVGIMTKLIDQSPSKRTVIQHGLLDMVLIASGSALGIQNLTFGDMQGFQREPTKKLIVDGQETGLIHTERGLTFLQVYKSGHMVPQDTPSTGYKMLQFLLGQISEADLHN